MERDHVRDHLYALILLFLVFVLGECGSGLLKAEWFKIGCLLTVCILSTFSIWSQNHRKTDTRESMLFHVCNVMTMSLSSSIKFKLDFKINSL